MADNRHVDIRPPGPAVDAGAAAWIAPRLLDDFGAVCRTLPTNFQAYARIFHPASAGPRASVRWAEVAEATGRTMHRQAQFDRIATPANDRIHASALPDIGPPEKGDLPPDQLATLCQILRPHTPDSIACWFAVWDGWGDLTGSTSTAFAYYGFGEPPAPPPPAPRHWQLDLGA